MTPDLQLRTLVVLDDRGRLLRTREPGSGHAPAFGLIRSADACAFAVRADVADDTAAAVAELGRDEPPVRALETPPRHEQRYVDLLGGTVWSGPAFSFPDTIDATDDVVILDDPGPLRRHYSDTADEFDGRRPIAVVLDDGHAVSMCCCARLSDEAAEAGLDTVEAYRGRGYGPRVTAAWALATRDTGRIPLYSTGWYNTASRAVAAKLGLIAYASDWSVSGSSLPSR